VDALIDKDADKLPVLRGRHLKGLIRNAAVRLAKWNPADWTDARVNLLFGRKAEKGRKSTPACLRFGNALLPDTIAGAVRSDVRLANELIRRFASTRIEFSTGAAMDKSLRSMEVAVPLKLYARLEWNPSGRLAIQPFDNEETADQIAKLAETWDAAIAECLPHVLAVGAHRNRGFGRAVLKQAGS
jgi:hypothetical protein